MSLGTRLRVEGVLEAVLNLTLLLTLWFAFVATALADTLERLGRVAS